MENADFTNIIGGLFFDRARNVPEEKQLPEDMVNSMYGTHFERGGYRLMVLCPQAAVSSEFEAVDGLLRSGGLAFLDCLREACRDVLYHFDFLRVRILLNYPAQRDGEMLDLLHRLYDRCFPAPCPVILCCSSLHPAIQDIHRMRSESSDIMWTRFTTAGRFNIHSGSLPPCPEKIRRVMDRAERSLKEAAAVLDTATFSSQLDAYFSLPDEVVGRLETRSMLRRVEYYMLDVNRGKISSFTDLTRVSRGLVSALRYASTLSEYKRLYRDRLVGLMEDILGNMSAQMSLPVRMARRYIQENHSHPLRLEDVAGHVGLSPVYLCSRLKQETGEGFTDYLNACRVEAAKKLLSETDQKILSVALSAGFSGPRYFSRVFKSVAGMRPTQYRSMSRKKSNG